MYRRLKNRLDVELMKEAILQDGIAEIVVERIAEIIQTLDDAYSASRSSHDMGGYVLLFKDTESYAKAFPEIMQFYNLKELEYEYSDNLTEGRKVDKQWWEELYLLSSDDALVLIHPKGGN